MQAIFFCEQIKTMCNTLMMPHILRKKLFNTPSPKFWNDNRRIEIKHSKLIVVERLDQITCIGINRPKKRNCINSETAKNLFEAIEAFEEDDTSSVGIIHGIGGNFCAGLDLLEISGMEEKKKVSLEIYNSSLAGLTNRLIKKPLVAAVSGYAVAEGLEIAMMCDLRVAEDNAIFGVYNRRFSVPCGNGLIIRLAAAIGLSRAMDLVLTGRSLSAEESFHWGLTNRVVACGTALGQAIQLAGSLVKFPQECLLKDRKNLYGAALKISHEDLQKAEKSKHVLNQESIEGAKKFVAGIGRHGKTYYLKGKTIPDWEKED